MDSTPTLVVENYALSYTSAAGPVRILDALSLEIGRGEVLGLVGESGSAKSSLANAVMRDLPGQVAHESGRILLSGDDLTAMDKQALEQVRGARISMVFQDAAGALDPTQTLGDHIEETLSIHLAMASAQARIRALELMDLVGLADPKRMHKRYAHEVSGGEKQRVLLALAFACDPELILFDEPTSALDATTAATLLDLFSELQARTGTSGLFISHDLGTVAAIAHRIAVMYGGRIVELATSEALFSNPRHPYTRALIASLPRPSDTRTGRQLDVVGSQPAPRIGEPPACVYSGSCANHVADACDVRPVTLTDVDGRLVACARTRDIASEPAHKTAAVLQAPVVLTDEPLLTVSALDVIYGRDSWSARLLGRASNQVRAVNGASITLRRGETLGLVGESGCGKSTLARALGGLVKYTGDIRLNGVPVSTSGRDYRSRVQMIFQNPDASLNPRHTVSTILSRPLRLFRDFDDKGRRAELAALLNRVRLSPEHAERFPHQLSGGEKQRVAIARALAAQPDVIVCDEITSGLDAAVQASIVTLLRDIQRENDTAMIFITHDLAILRHVADRLAVMYLGEIIETRDVASLDTPPYHPYTEALMSSSPSIDPLSETRLVRLVGELPKRTIRLAGCPFESRCPRRLDDRCANEPPHWQEPSNSHRLACHLPLETLDAVPPVWRTIDRPETAA